MRKIKYLFVVVFILVACTTKEKRKNSELVKLEDNISKPNIIIILTDDQGYGDVGFNGCKDIPTPNIDRIATNGVKFTNGYVTYAVCGPSRAGLITGRYQDRFGFCRNPLFAPKDVNMGLPLTEQTIAEELKGADYQTMAIGKWHLGAHEQLRPLNRGFDEFFGFLTGGHNYFPEDLVFNDLSELNGQWDPYRTKLLRNNSRIDEKEYLTDALSREAVSFVEKNKSNPFFLYLAFNAPHTPLQATDKYLERFNHIKDKNRKTYAAMVSAVDDGVGKLLDRLEALGVEKNTLVFFLSDNGGAKNNSSDNGELRDGKSSLYEGGIRVPFALQWPGKISKGIIYEEPVISLDIAATAMELAQVTPKNELDGINLIPFLTNKRNGIPHQKLFWRKYDDQSMAIRHGNMKLVQYKTPDKVLYNLKEDKGETIALKDSISHNLLFNSYKEWNAKNSDPNFLGLIHGKKYDSLYPGRWKEVEKY